MMSLKYSMNVFFANKPTTV